MLEITERIASRRALRCALFREFEDRYGPRLSLAWDGATPYWGELRTDFMEEFAWRAEGMSLRAFGEALAGSDFPTGWLERERKIWIGALGLHGIEYVNKVDRAKLIATAELLGLSVVLHEFGVTW